MFSRDQAGGHSLGKKSGVWGGLRLDVRLEVDGTMVIGSMGYFAYTPVN